jgi:esterase/lipase superfamily enzyme
MWMQNQFHQYVKHEVVPAIRMDCQSNDIGIWTAGASIGAFHAAAVVCRFPDLFHRALAMSGTFNLMRFTEAEHPTDYFRVSSPLYFVPHLNGLHLDTLRKRHVQMVTGEGKWENIGECWGLANVLGSKGVPNHVDSWGPKWDHDWVTWRAMMPKYLDEWTKAKAESAHA